MRIVGRDYILKLLNEDYFKSVFEIRKKYFVSGEPQELGKNSTIFFGMKNPSAKEYGIVGSAKPTFVRRVNSSDRSELEYSGEHNWHFVIELTEFQKFGKRIPADQVFSPDILKKISSQRPFGIELSPIESRTAKERINVYLLEQ